MKISLLRNTGLSLYYHLKDYLSIEVKDEELSTEDNIEYSSNHSLWYEVKPVIKINGEQTTDFKLDSYNGKITMDNELTDSDVVTATYKYSPVYIYDDYPDNLDDNELKLPAVSIVNEDTTENPYQLTSGKRVIRYYVIEVWAERNTQRDDLSEKIKEKFDQSLELIDFNLGFPIMNGRINYDFDMKNQAYDYLYLDDFRMHPDRTQGLGDKMLYVMSMDITIEHFR